MSKTKTRSFWSSMLMVYPKPLSLSLMLQVLYAAAKISGPASSFRVLSVANSWWSPIECVAAHFFFDLDWQSRGRTLKTTDGRDGYRYNNLTLLYRKYFMQYGVATMDPVSLMPLE